MSNKHNIEELFRSTFETFEAPVDPSVWAAVQSGIAAKGAGVTVAAKTGSSLIKTLIISGTTLVGGLALGYVFFGNPQTETKRPITPQNNTATFTKEENSQNTALTENIQPDHNIETEQQKTIDVVIPVEDKATGKKELVTIKVPEKPYSNKSIAHGLEKSNREQWNKYYEEREKEKQAKDIQNKKENNNVKTSDVKVEVEEVTEGNPVAFIVASKETGSAPLIVQFENSAAEFGYHWDFGDGNTSAEASPEHIYREPGTYNVKLTVKNKSGKSTVARKTIEVMVPSEITKIPNVFSPNNDGVNDVYLVLGTNIKLFNMSIYTKEGELLFSSNDILLGWNGEDQKGNPVPKGTYLVYVDAVGADNTTLRKGGFFVLER